MSSTLAVGASISVASSVSSNAPSPSSVHPSYTPSTSFGVNTVSSLTSVTASPATPVTTSGSSKQSQQPSSASQATMSVTAVFSTTAPASASPSVPSSTISPTSARASSTFSSTIPVTSSNDNQTSTSETSVQPTTPSASTTPTTTHSSTSTTSSPTTSLLGTTASSALISTAHSTSNIQFTTTSSSSSSDPSSQSSSVRTEMPLTTVLESTTVFITSTNSQGQVMTSAPPVVTEVITTTGSSGMTTTVTQAIVNPTLAPNNNTTEGSPFFADTGAVIGVFVVVGLASASIMMWILFAIRRRQRMRRFEQDTAVEAAVAAAGLNRAPLDDGDEGGSPISPNTHQFSSGMGQRSTLLGRGSESFPTSARLSEVLDDSARDSGSSQPGRPVQRHASSRPEGYVPARTTSPSPRGEQCTDDLRSSRDRKSSYGHTPTYSAGSFEPLLANYVQNVSDQEASVPIASPQNRPPQTLGSSSAPNGYSSDGSPVDGSRRTSLKRQNSSDSSALPRDEEDYTHYVLTVRNVPDGQSQHSL